MELSARNNAVAAATAAAAAAEANLGRTSVMQDAVGGVSHSLSRMSAGVCCFYCLNTTSVLNARMLFKGSHAPLAGWAQVCLFLLLLKYNFHFECENTVEGVSRFLSRMCAGMCCANSSYTELLLSVRVLLKGSHALLAGRAQVCVAFIAWVQSPC
jgi:hypothetical protein